MADSRAGNGAPTLPIEGHLVAFWEQGMEGELIALLDPTPPGGKQVPPGEHVWLREGDLLSVRSSEGREIWRGRLKRSRWFARYPLPRGWELWFDRGLPATLLERGRSPSGRRRQREELFYVTPYAQRPRDLRKP